MLTIIQKSKSMPIETAELKTHLRILHNYDDEYLKFMILSATDIIENYLGRSLINRIYSAKYFQNDCSDQLLLHNPPLQRVLAIKKLKNEFDGNRITTDFYDEIFSYYSIQKNDQEKNLNENSDVIDSNEKNLKSKLSVTEKNELNSIIKNLNLSQNKKFETVEKNQDKKEKSKKEFFDHSFKISLNKEIPTLKILENYGEVEIIYEAGYGTKKDSVPPAIRFAIMQVASEIYEKRDFSLNINSQKNLNVVLDPFRIISIF